MKTKKIISTMFASLLMMVLSFTATNLSAQVKKNCCKVKECCIMKDGKMMRQKDGKMIPMDKNKIMQDGTKCMTNGEYIMKDGKKMKMKEGECMNMEGKLDQCKIKQDNKKPATYTCSMNKK